MSDQDRMPNPFALAKMTREGGAIDVAVWRDAGAYREALAQLGYEKPLYTADQMREYAARETAMERAHALAGVHAPAGRGGRSSMTTRSSTATIAASLRILSRDIESEDGAANGCCAEAADRLDEILADLAVVLPSISARAGWCRIETDHGRAYRAAADRLAAVVLA